MAEVGSKVFVTINTCAPLRLLFKTSQTFDMRHTGPVHIMIPLRIKLFIVVECIMAQMARIKDSFTNWVGTLELARATVMPTTVQHKI